MKTIAIDEDIYDFLLRHTNRFGESESEVLRRVLKLATPGNGHTDGREGAGTTSTNQAGASLMEGPIQSLLDNPDFLAQGNAVGKFLSILSWLHGRHPNEFDKVLLLSGRKRRYFARSAGDLEASGNSVMPKPIPNTPFWVITNSPTELKKQTIAGVMRLLGYDPSSIRAVVETVETVRS